MKISDVILIRFQLRL